MCTKIEFWGKNFLSVLKNVLLASLLCAGVAGAASSVWKEYYVDEHMQKANCFYAYQKCGSFEGNPKALYFKPKFDDSQKYYYYYMINLYRRDYSTTYFYDASKSDIAVYYGWKNNGVPSGLGEYMVPTLYGVNAASPTYNFYEIAKKYNNCDEEYCFKFRVLLLDATYGLYGPTEKKLFDNPNDVLGIFYDFDLPARFDSLYVKDYTFSGETHFLTAAQNRGIVYADANRQTRIAARYANASSTIEKFVEWCEYTDPNSNDCERKSDVFGAIPPYGHNYDFDIPPLGDPMHKSTQNVKQAWASFRIITSLDNQYFVFRTKYDTTFTDDIFIYYYYKITFRSSANKDGVPAGNYAEVCVGSSPCTAILPSTLDTLLYANAGTNIRVRVHTNPGYRFVGWDGLGDSKNTDTSFFLHKDMNIGPRFEKIPNAVDAGVAYHRSAVFNRESKFDNPRYSQDTLRWEYGKDSVTFKVNATSSDSVYLIYKTITSTGIHHSGILAKISQASMQNYSGKFSLSRNGCLSSVNRNDCFDIRKEEDPEYLWFCVVPRNSLSDTVCSELKYFRLYYPIRFYDPKTKQKLECGTKVNEGSLDCMSPQGERQTWVFVYMNPGESYGAKRATMLWYDRNTGAETRDTLVIEDRNNVKGVHKYFSFVMPKAEALVEYEFENAYAISTRLEEHYPNGGTIQLSRKNGIVGDEVYAQIKPNPGYDCYFANVFDIENGNLIHWDNDDEQSLYFTLERSMGEFIEVYGECLPDKYKVSYSESAHCHVPNKTLWNETDIERFVDLTCDDERYVVKSVAVKGDKSGKNVEVSKVGDASYRYKMPPENVTLYITEERAYSRIEPPVGTAAEYLEFENVSVGSFVKIGDPVFVKVRPGYIIGIVYAEYETETDFGAFYLKRQDGGYSFEMPAGDVVVYAYNPVKLNTISCSLNIDVDCSEILPASAAWGDSVRIALNSVDGYEVEKVYYTTSESEWRYNIPLNENVFSFRMPDSDIKVYVKYRKILNVSLSNDDGRVVVVGPERLLSGGNVLEGNVVSFKLKNPSVHYNINVYDDSHQSVDVSEKDGVYSFVMPSRNVTIQADNYYKITYKASRNCSFVNPVESAYEGESVTISYECDLGYDVKQFAAYYNGGKYTSGFVKDDVKKSASYTVPSANVEFDLEQKIYLDWKTAADSIKIDTLDGITSISSCEITYRKTFCTVDKCYSRSLYFSEIKEIGDKTLYPVSGIDFVGGDYSPRAYLHTTETDGYGSIMIPFDLHLEQVYLTRYFSPEKFSSVVLPFSIARSNVSGGDFYQFSGIKKIDDRWVFAVKSKFGDNIEANKPYIVKPTTYMLRFEGPVTLNTKKNHEPQVSGNWLFVGNYEYKAWLDDDAEIGMAYGIAKNENKEKGIKAGDFVKVASGASVAPTYGFLLYEKAAASARPAAPGEVQYSATPALPDFMDIVVEDEGEQPMVIGTFNARTGEFMASDDRWFDMNGRILNAKPTQKGTYFHQGKRVIIK